MRIEIIFQLHWFLRIWYDISPNDVCFIDSSLLNIILYLWVNIPRAIRPIRLVFLFVFLSYTCSSFSLSLSFLYICCVSIYIHTYLYTLYLYIYLFSVWCRWKKNKMAPSNNHQIKLSFSISKVNIGLPKAGGGGRGIPGRRGERGGGQEESGCALLFEVMLKK